MYVIRRFPFLIIFATNQHAKRNMTNQEFTEYIEYRLECLHKLAATDRPENYEAQERLLQQALKIMTHGTGPARRRFRRDYQRRMGL